MLQKLHDKIKGWVAGLIIGLIGFIFIIWGAEYYFTKGTAGDVVVAKVNGTPILQKTVDDLVRQLRQRVKRNDLPDSLVQQQLQAVVLQSLTASLALSQAAARAGIIITKEQLQQVIMQAPEFQVNGKFSLENFQRFVSSLGFTQQQFFKDLQSNLAVNQLAAAFEASTFILSTEFEYYYRLFYQQRRFRYMVIPAKQFVSQVKVTEEEKKKFYENNKEVFEIPDKVSIEYIKLRPQAMAKKVQILDAEVEQYYRDHKINYQHREVHGKRTTKPFREVKDIIRHQLEQNKLQQKMEILSQKVSELLFTHNDTLKPAAKKIGVDIQITDLFDVRGAQRGVEANAEIVQAAFSKGVLTERNNSELINLKDGSMLALRIHKHIPAFIPPYTAVKDKVREELIKKKAQAEAALLANELYSRLQKKQPIKGLMTKYHLNWVMKNNIMRDNKQLSKEILQAVFMTNLNHPLTVSTESINPVLIQLLAIAFPDSNKLPMKQKLFLQKELRQLLSQKYYEAYTTGIKSKTRIKFFTQT